MEVKGSRAMAAKEDWTEQNVGKPIPRLTAAERTEAEGIKERLAEQRRAQRERWRRQAPTLR